MRQVGVGLLIVITFFGTFLVATCLFDALDRACGYYTTQMQQMEAMD